MVREVEFRFWVGLARGNVLTTVLSPSFTKFLGSSYAERQETMKRSLGGVFEITVGERRNTCLGLGTIADPLMRREFGVALLGTRDWCKDFAFVHRGTLGTTLKSEGELRMVDTHEPEDRRVKIVDMESVLDCMQA